jgi:integrase
VQDWLNPIKRHAYPVMVNVGDGRQRFGEMRVTKVEATHVAAVMKAIDKKGLDAKKSLATIRRKVHANLRAVFDAQIALGHRDAARGNPAAKGTVKAITPTLKHVTKHYRRITLDDAPGVFQKLVGAAQDHIGIAAWVFMALTAARPNEVLNARWDQIDFVKKQWSNPSRKARKEGDPLPVPLSPIALRILELQRTRSAGDFVFARENGAPIATDALADAPTKKVEINAGSPHSWRSIFRDAAVDRCGFDERTAEYALAHSLGKNEAAYRQLTAVEKRTLLMSAYENWLMGKATASNVVLLRAAGG